MPRTKREKLTYEDFLEKVREYVDKHNKSGVEFVCKYEKWLDIYYSNHENKAYTDLIVDERFKAELGIPKKKRIRKNGTGKEQEKEKESRG